MGSRRDVANRRQHRSGCASPPTTTSSSVSLSCTLSAPVSPSVPLLLFARRGIARSRSLRRVAIRLSRSVALPLARSRGPFVSLPLDRRSLPSLSHVGLPRGVLLSLARFRGFASTHGVCIFLCARASLLFPSVRPARTHRPRNSVESRERAFDTLVCCALCAGGETSGDSMERLLSPREREL